MCSSPAVDKIRKFDYQSDDLIVRQFEKTILPGKIEGTTRPGRPNARWTDQIRTLVGQPLPSVYYRLTQDRQRWHVIMKVSSCQP